MRKFPRRAKALFLLILMLASGGFLYALVHSPVFEDGEEYTFYLGANSSARAESSKRGAKKLLLPGVRGESVRYEGDCRDELVLRFGARLLFREESCGIVNEYFYSPYLSQSVELYGEKVNLHIAVSKTHTVAGSPIIFGGY